MPADALGQYPIPFTLVPLTAVVSPGRSGGSGRGFALGHPLSPLLLIVRSQSGKGIIEGDLPRRARALVLEWAALHRAELRQAWDLASRNQAPSKIQPLE